MPAKTTKTDAVTRLLRRSSGATIAQLQKTTGWQPHSVRAALTGLCKKGHDVQRDPVLAKRLLGYVPDHPFLYDKLTGYEFLRFVAGLYQMEAARFRERAEQMLDQFEIAHVADQLIENYSHGMRQKLSFASCFLHDPQAVIVDEPWVGLDPKNIHRVKQYLRRRADEGLTVLMSTHTLSIAEEVGDRIGIIHRGRLLTTGSVNEIKALAADGGGSATLEDVFLELTRDDEP